MVTAQAAPSLLEDWQTRLDRVGTDRAAKDDQVRVLEYLIQRYGESDIARQTALFPAPQDTYLNSRAILVHHHLRPAGGPPSERARTILNRISDQKLQSSLGEPGSGMDIDGDSLRQAWRDFVGGFRRKSWLVKVVRRLDASDILEESAVQLLIYHRFEQPTIPLLARCRNASVVAWALDLWREEREPSHVAAILSAPHHRERALRCIREELASPVLHLRLRALAAIVEMGSVHDIGLLLDLLDLPLQADDVPLERERLRFAARFLAKANRTGE